MGIETSDSTVEKPTVFDVVRAELHSDFSLASKLTWQRLHIQLADWVQAQKEPTAESLTLVTAWNTEAQGTENYAAVRRLKSELHAAGASAERLTVVFQSDGSEPWSENWFASIGISADHIELLQSHQHPVLHIGLDHDVADVESDLAAVRDVDHAWLIAQPQCHAENWGVKALRGELESAQGRRS